MTRRVADERDHLWPITGQRCPICRMPADPVLEGAPHPGCAPRPADQQPGHDRTALQLAVELLSASHPINQWVISRRPVRTLRPELLAPRTGTTVSDHPEPLMQPEQLPLFTIAQGD
jgi:hypothetical protein